MAAQMRHDHPVARRRQQRRDIDEAVNIVGPAVQKNYRRTIGGAAFSVSNIQDAGIDLFHSFHLFSHPARMTRKAARPPATTNSIPIPLPARSFLAGRSVTYPAPLP